MTVDPTALTLNTIEQYSLLLAETEDRRRAAEEVIDAQRIELELALAEIERLREKDAAWLSRTPEEAAALATECNEMRRDLDEAVELLTEWDADLSSPYTATRAFLVRLGRTEENQ